MSFNILLVDDSKTVRAVISKTLELAGVPVNKLYDNNWVDIVFTDINMPVMTGIEMIEKMSENDLLKNIPVVIISTEGSRTRIEMLKSKGISDYIRKPFTPEQIKKAVDNITG